MQNPFFCVEFDIERITKGQRLVDEIGQQAADEFEFLENCKLLKN